MRFRFAIVCLGLAACLSGCATGGGAPAGAWGPAEQARAEQLFASLTSDFEGGRLDNAANAASELVNKYPAFGRMDEALSLAGDVAVARKDASSAALYYEKLLDSYPTSTRRAHALMGAAAAARDLGDPVREAEHLLELMAAPVDAATRANADRRLTELVDTALSPAELEKLAASHPGSSLARASALKQARAAYAAGDYARCHTLLDGYLAALPRGETGEEARLLMQQAAERQQSPAPAPATRVDPDRIGVLIPQTGPAAQYGRLFEQGVKLAVDEHNTDHARRVTVSLADSRGGAVGAVKAVRKLIVEEGAVAVLGDVLTLPATAGAIEANAWRTAIVSPVVASDEMGDIGPWVFQTRVPATVEATAVAEAAVARLGVERVAVLAPARGERREVADFFVSEIRRLGREVIAIEYFDDGATDFRTQFEKIREAAPDAIFAAGSVEELLQMLPQVKFHDLAVQLLGLSTWNSDKLMRHAQDELEGAVFPAESHYGATAETDRKVRARIVAGGATDASPVTMSAYYGARLLLQTMDAGAASREDVRVQLEKRLKGDAKARAERAAQVPLVRVRNGRTEPFVP